VRVRPRVRPWGEELRKQSPDERWPRAAAGQKGQPE
jgi:hypothetical protein